MCSVSYIVEMGDNEANGTIVQRHKAGDMTPREGDGSEEVNR